MSAPPAPPPAHPPAPPSSGTPRAGRVAVIVIHGVADQKAGDTARAIASLMVNAGAPRARYTRGDCDSYIVAVPPLLSMVESGPHGQGAARKRVVPRDASPAAAGTDKPTAVSLRKALRQSVRSDFLRDNWSTASQPPAGAAATQAASASATTSASAAAAATATAAPGRPQSAPARLMSADAGIAFSDYLLFKWQGAGHEAYEATRIRMTRRENASGIERRVDVHEMYWADLSRLSGVLPRIVTELFTMVFRLSQLGRDAVDRAGLHAAKHRTRGAFAWGWLIRLQMALDWAFSGVLANLFLQLLLAGLVIAGLGLAAPHAGRIHIALALLLPGLAAWWYCYLHVLRPLRRSWAVALAVLAALGLCLVPAPWAHWLIGLTWLALLGLLFNYGLRVADTRFPAMRAAGLVFLGAMALTLLAHVAMASFGPDGAGNGAGSLDDWVRAGLRTVEYVLLGVVIWWLLAGGLLIAWAVFGQLAARDDDAARASVATGRLGLFVSIASFVTLAMAIWALMTTFVELGAAHTAYDPQVFKSGLLCFLNGGSFLHLRYQRSTETFALAAGLTLALALYLGVVLVPSVLAEVRKTVGTAHALGRWLTGGYRRLDGFVTGLTIASVLMACGVGVLLALARLGVEPDGWVGAAAHGVGELSEFVLKPLVLSAATAAAALSAFGGVLSRYAPWVRLPLDVALDVDNHFREFPRSAIPRARIFSRYVALLESVAAQGYDRVVIVAHSQGTVISAELLRYLQHRARWLAQACPNDRVVKLWSQLEGRVDLLTAGCPLRQLYAARFPHLYEWVMQARAGDVGVCRWVNAYATGDYVGRWLWADPPLYKPSPPVTVTAGPEHDVCLGSGAHTHYFDQEQVLVARWIDALVR
jgi:hypothetical protein